MSRLPQYPLAPDAAHTAVKIVLFNARHDRQAVICGVVSSFLAASGVEHMVWPPGDRHHAVAQCPLNGPSRQSPEGFLQ
ncbi:MAG: hypothetical protein WCE69_06735 [Aestuariivirga sp.]